MVPKKTDSEETTGTAVTSALPPGTDTPPAPAAAVVLPVESWATAKGMLPQIFPGGALMVEAPGQPIARVSLGRSGAAAPRHNPRYRLFAAAKAMFQWPEGRTMTEGQFDASVRAADTGVSLR